MLEVIDYADIFLMFVILCIMTNKDSLACMGNNIFKSRREAVILVKKLN